MNDVDRDIVAEIASLRVTKIGGSAGVVLPEHLLAHLKLKEGDTLHVFQESDGSLRLSRFDADYIKTIKIADKTMDKYQDTFVALAK